MIPSPEQPLARAHTLPASWYHEPAWFQRERHAVFAREWLLLGHEAELLEPGSTRAQCVAGWPIFVRRGSDGSLRGFHDVCRHRAGPIVGLPAPGAATVVQVPHLRCRYHGWLYDEQGKLERTPDFGEVDDFDRGDYGLHALRVESWRGFVFATMDPHAPPLVDALGRLPELTESIDFARFAFHSRVSHSLRCNWKTYVENYLEGYHIPYVHPQLRREVDVKTYEVVAERRVVTHHASPRPTALDPVYDGLWAWLYPNAALNVYGDGLSLERMVPVGPSETRIEYLFFFARGADADAARAMCAGVTAEDAEICEAVQRNLAAGVYERGRLSPRHEAGVYDFQQRLRTALADADAPA